ncbi:MAG: hypothetical protein K0S27_738 [Gammaproteobacteria bacterium]|jgi:hypothetical protein|nr:hypothetical protein [Gammaproteobacteria bacterium]
MPAVTIRIWSDRRINSTGHISLETPNHYISFWPDNPKYDEWKEEEKEELLIKRIPGKGCLVTFKCDRYYTNYGAPIEQELHTLKVKKIERQFEEFMAGDDFEWNKLNGFFRLFSSSYPAEGENVEKVKNCSGLVTSLLYAGGIEKLLPKRISLMKGAFFGATGAIGGLLLFGGKRNDDPWVDVQPRVSKRNSSVDGDSTTVSGLTTTSVLSAGSIFALSRASNYFSSDDPACFVNAAIGGAILGAACGFLGITDSGPSLPIRDVGNMVRVAAAREEQRLAQSAAENDSERYGRAPEGNNL